VPIDKGSPLERQVLFKWTFAKKLFSPSPHPQANDFFKQFCFAED